MDSNIQKLLDVLVDNADMSKAAINLRIDKARAELDQIDKDTSFAIGAIKDWYNSQPKKTDSTEPTKLVGNTENRLLDRLNYSEAPLYELLIEVHELPVNEQVVKQFPYALPGLELTGDGEFRYLGDCFETVDNYGKALSNILRAHIGNSKMDTTLKLDTLLSGYRDITLDKPYKFEFIGGETSITIQVSLVSFEHTLPGILNVHRQYYANYYNSLPPIVDKDPEHYTTTNMPPEGCYDPC